MPKKYVCKPIQPNVQCEENSVCNYTKSFIHLRFDKKYKALRLIRRVNKRRKKGFVLFGDIAIMGGYCNIAKYNPRDIYGEPDLPYCLLLNKDLTLDVGLDVANHKRYFYIVCSGPDFKTVWLDENEL